MSRLVRADAPIKTKVWIRHCAAFNQGDIGSCTGNAETGLLMTEPFYVSGRELSEKDAVDLYSLATHIDPIDGQSYPPADTGSTGLDVCKAAQQKGYITGYHHGFVIATVYQYLSNVGPVIMGTDWYDDFDKPDSKGIVHLSPNASVRGGHEIQVSEIHVEDRLLGIWNSWGPDWGMHGQFFMSFDIFEQMMSSDADIAASVTASVT